MSTTSLPPFLVTKTGEKSRWGWEDFRKDEHRLSVEGGGPVEAMTQEARSAEPAAFAKTIKPRALIFKAANKAFDKITELIKSEFPEVEIYILIGPVKKHPARRQIIALWNAELSWAITLRH